MFIQYKGRFGKVSEQTATFMKNDGKEFGLEKLEMSKDMTDSDGKEMICEEFYEFLSNSYFFDSMIQDMKWSQTERTESLMAKMIHEADKAHVFLTDIEDFQFDKFFTLEIKNFKL